MKAPKPRKHKDSPPKTAPSGRLQQRDRTRSHIVAKTQELLRSGASPSMSDIAGASGVARRTLYLHFPTLEQLLIDARVGLLSESSIDLALVKAAENGDVESRVIAMIDAIGANASDTLSMGRSLIRLTVDGASKGKAGKPVRGYRRMAWIRTALEPVRTVLSEQSFEQLASSLAMVIGWEALIVLHDVCGQSNEQALETIRWAARALLGSALQEGRMPVRASSKIRSRVRSP